MAGNAQLCTGSLGDPVVNIDFGSGGNPGPALPSNITNYIYVTTPCPQDGYYTIANSTANCFQSTWHTIPEDHTPGDVNGYMMLINASFDPGVFFLDTVKNLCGGTTYEFSAWILSLLKSSSCGGNGIKPNISFSIETAAGKIIKSYNTGDIPNLSAPQWNQYGFFFTMPSGLDKLVLRMINNAPGGCGNDLALDDITFRPCGPKVNAAFVNLNGINDTAFFCISDKKTITLDARVQAGYNSPSFQWQQSTDGGSWQDIPGAIGTTFTHSFTASGSFRYRIAVAESGNIGIARCRVSSSPLTVVIDTIPDIQASNTSPVCANAPVALHAKNGYAYAWTGPGGFSAASANPSIPAATAGNAGEYYIQASTRGRCTRQDSTLVIVNPLPRAGAGRDTTICAGSSILLQASGGSYYSWSPVTGLSNTAIPNPRANPGQTTTYTVTVINAFRCSASDSVKITVQQTPVAHAGPGKKITSGQSVQLQGSVKGNAASYYWTPPLYISNPGVLNPVVSPVQDMVYTLHAVSDNGCGATTDEVFIRVFQQIKVPNAFSPNGDGIHDVWEIESLETYPESETRVFNRYGQMIFRSRGYGKPWDGKLNGKTMPAGTYYYTIDRKNNLPLISGWVMIIL